MVPERVAVALYFALVIGQAAALAALHPAALLAPVWAVWPLFVVLPLVGED